MNARGIKFHSAASRLPNIKFNTLKIAVNPLSDLIPQSLKPFGTDFDSVLNSTLNSVPNHLEKLKNRVVIFLFGFKTSSLQKRDIFWLLNFKAAKVSFRLGSRIIRIRHDADDGQIHFEGFPEE